VAKGFLWALIVVLALAMAATVRDHAYAKRAQREAREPADFFINVVEPQMRRERAAELSQSLCDAPPRRLTTQPATLPATPP
jgi:hypothetical protein